MIADFLCGDKPGDMEGCNLQIGRHFPLSPNKGTSHFPRLYEHTGIPYNKMIFFDDCNWEDNDEMVKLHCPGVTTQRTPHGLTIADWESGLALFASANANRL